MRTRMMGMAVLLAALALTASAEAGSLDPSLARATGDAVHVWVTFTDKGVPAASRSAELARAEAALSPRNRERRLRAGVWPLVDDYDLPVSATYLDSLRALGFEPYAVSRWLNRAAVRVPATRLAGLAMRPWIARVAPVTRGIPIQPQSPGRALTPRVRPAPAPAGSGGATPGRGPRGAAVQAIDHGLLEPALRRLGIPALHDSGYVGAGVLVCVLDNGFTRHDFHEALRTRAPIPGGTRDFVDGDTIVTGTGSFFLTHGTKVLGCLAGAAPARYVGAAFGVDLALARTEDDFHERPVEMLYWASGAEWADSLGADIINSSLGYSTWDSAAFEDIRYEDLDGHTTDITRAAEIAASKGILVVNAVGNSGNQTWHYLVAPADVHGDSLIAVGAVDLSGAVWSGSSYGPTADGRIKPDLAAPGVSVPVVGTGPDSTAYFEETGTSLSTPLVAGLAACVMQARPAWTPRDIIRALRETASNALHPNVRIGWGVPDGARALGMSGPNAFQPNGTLGIALYGNNPLVEGGYTTVTFGLKAGTPSRNARVRVFDVRGRSVRELWSGMLDPGVSRSVPWDGRDDDAHALRPGIYWIAVEGGGDLASARLAWIR